jgi:hypothetical protein
VSFDLVLDNCKSRREEVVEGRRGDRVLRYMLVSVLFLGRNSRYEFVIREESEGSDLVNLLRDGRREEEGLTRVR